MPLSITVSNPIYADFFWGNFEENCIWVKSRNCGCLVTWFCYQLIAKPGNKTAEVPWLDPFAFDIVLPCCHVAISWIPTSWKTRNCLSYITNTILSAHALSPCMARASVAMILTKFILTIPGLSQEMSSWDQGISNQIKGTASTSCLIYPG